MALYTFGINEKFGNNFTAANCTDNSPSKIVNMCIQYNRHNFYMYTYFTIMIT